MNDAERQRHSSEMTDFRYQIVAELANPYLSAAERRRMVYEKAQIEYEVPGVGRRRLSEGCILKWLSAYRKQVRGRERPPPSRESGAKVKHVSTAKLLEKRKGST